MADGIAARLALRDKGSMLPFAVRDAAGRFAGMTTYMNADAAHRRVEIGSTWYRRSVQRTALNTEAKLLLLTHVVGDVPISAACGVWSKLAGLKGRRTGYDERADAAKLRELDDLQAGRLLSLEVPVDHITGLKAQYPVGRRACINDAVTRLEAMQKEAAARQATALAETIRAFSVVR